MTGQKCFICKIAGLLAIVGALNWGLVGLVNLNLVTRLLGEGTTPTRVVYILVGLSGLLLLAGCFLGCPGCKKCCNK